MSVYSDTFVWYTYLDLLPGMRIQGLRALDPDPDPDPGKKVDPDPRI